MTQEQKVIRAKVGVLELAKQLGNVIHSNCLHAANGLGASPPALGPFCQSLTYLSSNLGTSL